MGEGTEGAERETHVSDHSLALAASGYQNLLHPRQLGESPGLGNLNQWKRLGESARKGA